MRVRHIILGILNKFTIFSYKISGSIKTLITENVYKNKNIKYNIFLLNNNTNIIYYTCTTVKIIQFRKFKIYFHITRITEGL